MQRLVKPSDYVLQDVLGQSMYLIPWESRLCPGNPAENPDSGAQLYNEFVQAQANGVLPRTPAEQMNDILDWVLEMAGEPARRLAADLAAAYLGKHAFLIEDLAQWDAETKAHRAHLVLCGEDIRGLSAKNIMALRARAVLKLSNE